MVTMAVVLLVCPMCRSALTVRAAIDGKKIVGRRVGSLHRAGYLRSL
jgi:uncharacterized protein YbaR (Trm112 family)